MTRCLMASYIQKEGEKERGRRGEDRGIEIFREEGGTKQMGSEKNCMGRKGCGMGGGGGLNL